MTVGTNDGSPNVFPYGSPNFYSGEYQQVYTASAFSGTVSISSIGFATSSGGVPNTVTFSVGLSTTSATVASMSTNYAANKGHGFTTVFTGSKTFSGGGGGAFDFVIPISAFTYNSTKGNLLLDVVVTSSTGSGNVPFETWAYPVKPGL